MLGQVRTWASVAGAAALFTLSASAQYSDGFESYPASAGGTAFTPGGGYNSGQWKQWDAAANSDTACYGTGAVVAAHGGSQYIGTDLLADTIREWSTYTSGHWELSVWTYVPGAASATPMQDSQWLVMLNEYNDLGPYVWATQIEFDPLLGEVRADNGYILGTTTPQWGVGTTLTFDAWKEVTMDVDVTNDIASISYDGAQLGAQFSWAGGPYANNPVGTLPAIACIDLYANSSVLSPSEMYWDDVAITDLSGPPAPTTYCTVGTTSGGCNPAIGFSGTPSASAASGFTLTCNNVDAARTGLFFYAVTDNTFVPVQWGVGGTSYLCVKAPTQRMNAQNSGGTTGCTGNFSQDWNAFMANPVNASALGNPRAAGASFDAQLWMRDPPAPKTTTLSNACRFVLGT